MKQLEGAIGTGQAKITGKSSGDAGRPPRRPASWIRIRRSGRIPSDCQIGNCASYGAIESARLKRPLPAPTLACFTPTLAPCAGGRRTLLLEEWAGALVERREGLVARYRGDELEVVPRPLGTSVGVSTSNKYALWRLRPFGSIVPLPNGVERHHSGRVLRRRLGANFVRLSLAAFTTKPRSLAPAHIHWRASGKCYSRETNGL